MNSCGGSVQVAPCLVRKVTASSVTATSRPLALSAVGVATEVLDDCGRAGKGRFDVDVPVQLGEPVEQGPEARGVESRVGAEGPARVRLREPVEKLPAKDRGEDIDVNEELLVAGHPAISGGVESPTREDAVDVVMEGEFAGPGVEDEAEADLGAEVCGVAAQIGQGVGRRREQEIEDERFVPPRQRAQFGGQGEDGMEVVRREQPLGALRHPLVLGGPLTRRAEAAQAGVVERDLAGAGLALVEVAAQRLGAAVLDRPHGPALLVRDRVGAPKRLAVRAEDVGDVTAWRPRWGMRVHAGTQGAGGGGMWAAMASSGERVAAIKRVLTCT